MLDLAAARRWAATSRSLLSEFRQEIDQLNVFPVPDGDTGTNMFLTVDGALGFMRGQDEDSASPIGLAHGLRLLARGMLLSARGNSGVILSQLALGMSHALEATGAEADHMSADVLCDAFRRAADRAWAGVSQPVEGTILSVAQAAADGAAQALSAGGTPSEEGDQAAYPIALAALESARAALARTPEQLPSLARAGVVDAGGAGFVVVLEALESVLADRAHEGTLRSAQAWRSAPAVGLAAPECESAEGAYEVMYVLDRCTPAGADQLREELLGLGSSVLVVGGPDLWRVHVHLDHAAGAIDAGSSVGRVEQVTIVALEETSFASSQAQAPATALDLICCAPGRGLASVFAEAGAAVVHSSAGNRASTGQLLRAARKAAAPRVAILPNDPDTILAADAAAAAGAEEGLRVSVVPTLAAVQGLAAVSVWDREESDVERALHAMAQAARSVRYGALTVATADGFTPVGACRQGQWLGLVAAEIVTVDDDPNVVAHTVLSVLSEGLAEEAELLTVVEGESVAQAGVPTSGDISDAVERWRGTVGEVDVRRVVGGQRTYHWLLGLE